MEFKFLIQSQVTAIELENIISLKKNHWDYSIEDHNDWIRKNIYENDIHVLMLENDVLVGYLNLIKTEVTINNESHQFLGIGNVCTKDKGRGYGKKLMMEVNNYLIVNTQSGILLCKDSLVKFYEKANWIIVNNSLKNQILYLNINFLLFNYHSKILNFSYSGRNF